MADNAAAKIEGEKKLQQNGERKCIPTRSDYFCWQSGRGKDILLFTIVSFCCLVRSINWPIITLFHLRFFFIPTSLSLFCPHFLCGCLFLQAMVSGFVLPSFMTSFRPSPLCSFPPSLSLPLSLGGLSFSRTLSLCFSQPSGSDDPWFKLPGCTVSCDRPIIKAGVLIQILFSFSFDKDRITDSRIRRKNTADPTVSSSIFVGAEREENLIKNDPDKSELSTGFFTYSTSARRTCIVTEKERDCCRVSIGPRSVHATSEMKTLQTLTSLLRICWFCLLRWHRQEIVRKKARFHISVTWGYKGNTAWTCCCIILSTKSANTSAAIGTCLHFVMESKKKKKKKNNGSHFDLPASSIHRMAGLGGNFVWTVAYSHWPTAFTAKIGCRLLASIMHL